MELSETQIDELDKLVHLALRKVYLDDKYLVDNSVHERAIVFRFGLYFSDLLKSSIFAEYILDFDNNKINKEPNTNGELKNRMIPDIVLHKRDEINSKILILEFKCEWNKNDKAKTKDWYRLKKFTNQNGEYKFQLGIYCEFWSGEAESIYFVNGKKLDRLPRGIWMDDDL